MPIRDRRAATQRVREARDRLTSSKRHPPGLRSRTASAICPNADLGVVRRDVAGGGNRPAVRFLDAADGRGGLEPAACSAFMRHHPNCGRFLSDPPELTATRKWRTRFVLLDLFYWLCWTAILIHPASVDVVSNTLMMFLMLLVIAVRACWRQVCHRSLGRYRSGHLGGCAEFRAGSALSTIYVLALLSLTAEGYFALLATGCIRRRWRHSKRAPKRTR